MQTFRPIPGVQTINLILRNTHIEKIILGQPKCTKVWFKSPFGFGLINPYFSQIVGFSYCINFLKKKKK